MDEVYGVRVLEEDEASIPLNVFERLILLVWEVHCTQSATLNNDGLIFDFMLILL